MQEKTQQILIRVSPKEKKKLERNAKKSGLSLSSYLRKTGLKEEIYSIPDKDFYKIYVEISELKSKLFDTNIYDINADLEQIKRHFLEIYNSEKVGDNDGYD